MSKEGDQSSGGWGWGSDWGVGNLDITLHPELHRSELGDGERSIDRYILHGELPVGAGQHHGGAG